MSHCSQSSATHSAVLWDMDGVLVDTGEIHFQAWLKILPEAGIPFNHDLFRRSFGMNNAGVLEFLLGHPPAPALLEEISERKEAAFRQLVHGNARLLPGVSTWLERLQGQGCCQAIASSAPVANIDTLVDELGIRSYFAVLVSAADMPGKPDPAVFLEAAHQLQMPPRKCIVVEDAIAGVEAAHRAGMKCIAVTNTNSRQALSRADIIVDNLADLPSDAFDL